MSTTEHRSSKMGGTAGDGGVDMKLEVVTIPVSDVDRATASNARLGCRQDVTPPTVVSYASFRDPDGNGWLFREVSTRLPGRVDPATTTHASTKDLASALRRAEVAHGEHEKRTGQVDAHWPDGYADYMVREQAGTELPS
jgi:hypothetical protein